MATLAYTPLEEIEKIRAELQAGFDSGKTKSIAFRKYQLLQLAYLIQDNAKAFEDALASDLGRHALESNFFQTLTNFLPFYSLEITGSIAEIMEAYKNVESWAKPEKPPLSVNWMFMRPVMYKEPKGVVLIISPFNYPLWLCASPLSGAIAAGNAVVIKPSEACPATANLLAELIPKYLDPSLARVVNGYFAFLTVGFFSCWNFPGVISSIPAMGALERLSQQPLQRLSPLYLWSSVENPPVFVDPATDMQLAAKRILWGKFTNGGQTCVAPDYVLVPKAAQEPLVEAMKTAYANFYPETTGDSPTPPQNITKMVHQAAFKRVHGLVQNTKGTIVVGGEADEATKFIAPTIVKDVKVDDSLMSEFSVPVLPIVPVEDLDAGIAYVNQHDHPLALYVFSQSEAYKNKVFTSTQSGSAVANETIISPAVTGLPFGGLDTTRARQVLNSDASFSCRTSLPQFGFMMFTHLRASIDSPGWIDKLLAFRFPPYTPANMAKIKARLGVKLPPRPTGPPTVATTASGAGRKWFLLAFAVAVLGALTKMKNRLAVIKA
ncbi:Aldehyde dehydrogenase [Mycena venus]|uniref:Aldehyde dehydrogenase n=1 Tax=Mycena venus TaxID=2733690 RepID=A0A8H6XC17_9AGAR|nr:Aldehyde dehydrogenase [Mycena venus]